MPPKSQATPDQFSLQFYWYEIDENETPGLVRGQLKGGIHRLHDVYDELSRISRRREIVSRLHLATNLIESYFLRVYELRERVVHMLGIITGEPKLVGKVKKPEERARAVEHMKASLNPDLIQDVERLLLLMDEEILLRNMQTHHQYLSIGLFVGGQGIWDPEDVLLQYEDQPDARSELERLLRAGIKKLVKEYRARIVEICEVSWRVVSATDPCCPIKRSPGGMSHDNASTS